MTIYYLTVCNFIAKCIILTLISILILTIGFIVYIGIFDKIHASDVAIIPGTKINRNGTLSSRLIARLDTGIALYRQGVFRTIIVSGGISGKGFDEAARMKSYLVAQHIPKSSIISDNQGFTTRDTVINSRAIMAYKNFNKALIISQYFHIARTKVAFRQCGIAPIFHAHTSDYEWRDLYAIGREVVAIYYYLLFPKGCAN